MEPTTSVVTSKFFPFPPKYGTKSVQTGTDERVACAIIEVSHDRLIYSVKCFHCAEEFPIWSWSNFIGHINMYHKDLARPQGDTECLYSDDKPATESFVLETLEIIESWKSDLDELCESSVDQSVIVTHVGPNTEKKNVATTLPSVQERSNSTDSDLSDADMLTIVHGEDDFTPTPPPEQEISFENSPQDLILDVLEVLKNFQVLWYTPKELLEDAYDVAVVKLTNAINENHNLTIKRLSMHALLTRIREWYWNLINSELVLLDDEKFTLYFDKCSEFLPKKDLIKRSRGHFTLPCNICNNMFRDEIDVQVHQLMQHKVVNWPIYNESQDTKTDCDICLKKFPSPRLYRRHKVLHDPPKYKCRICGKPYLRKFLYMEHLKMHRDERDFVCDLCGKAFIRQKNMRAHKMNVHGAERRFKCNICGNSYSDFGGLHNHKKKTHLVLEGSIEQLQRRSGRVYDKHEFIIDPVTKEKRLKCDECPNTYARHAGLRNHKINTHGFVPRSVKAPPSSTVDSSSKEKSANEEVMDDESWKTDDETVALTIVVGYTNEENEVEYPYEDSQIELLLDDSENERSNSSQTF